MKGTMIATQRQRGSGFLSEFSKDVERARVQSIPLYSSNPNEPFGYFCMLTPSLIPARMKIIVSDGLGWDHVSVSTEGRIPTWTEMEWIRRMFFKPTCCVVQFHPPLKEYINNHHNVLHLWHKQGIEYELPPRECV